MPCILTSRFCRETLYGVGRVPSDTRERLDEVDPRQLRRCFTKLFQICSAEGIGCLRALRSFDRRNRIFFVGQGALSKLLRKTSP